MRYQRIENQQINRYNLLLDGFELTKNCTYTLSEPSIKNFIDIYKQLSWIHANPSNPDLQKKIENTYIKPKDPKSDFLSELKDYIENKETKLILVEGRRGSGKTFLQNYFLNTQMPKLKDTTWFRVDISKIYAYNQTHMSDYIDFEKYLWAQIVFVFFRYYKEHKYNGIEYGKDKCFAKILNKDTEQNDIFKDTSLHNETSEQNEFIDKIRKTEHGNYTEGKPFAHQDTKQIALNILNKLHNENIKVILFIDGIDNAPLTNKNYKNCRTKINNFIKNCISEQSKTPYSLFSKIVFASRTELDIEYELKQTLEFDSQYNKNIKIHIVIENSIEINQVLDNIEKYAKSENTQLPNNLINDIKEIIKQTQLYMKNKLNINNANFINTIFDGDLRDAIYNLISTYVWMKQHLFNFNNYGFATNSLKDIFSNIEEDKHNSKKRDRLQEVLIEGIFKNGCFYTPDIKVVQYTPPYRGLGFTNIFNPSFYLQLSYSPMISLYILKYLQANQDGIKIKTLKDECQKYNICEANKAYNTYSAIYALVEYNYLELNDNNVKITQKGKIVYKTVLNNIDVFASNIYYALEPINKKLNISTYGQDGSLYIKTLLHNSIVYINFLEKHQDSIIENLAGPTIKGQFQTNIKINLMESFRSQIIKKFENSKYTYMDIIEGLNEDEIKTFDELLYLPSNYKQCTNIIKSLSKKQLIDTLNEFFKKRTLGKDTISSQNNNQKKIEDFEIKLIILYRIFEKQKNTTSISIDDFIFDIEDSASLKKLISLETLDTIENTVRRVLSGYLRVQDIELWKHISNLLEDYCNDIFGDQEK